MRPAPRLLPTILSALAPALAPAIVGLVLAGALAPSAAAQNRRENVYEVPPTAIIAGETVPPLVGYDLSNEVVELPWSEHRLHLVVFWAPYSQPSLNQLPAVQKLYAKHAGDGLDVVGVTWERLPLVNLKSLREDVGLEFPMLMPHAKFDKVWRTVGAFPTAFLVDAEGKVLRRYLGWSEEHGAALANDVAAALAGEPLGPVVQPTREQYVTRSEAARRRRS